MKTLFLSTIAVMAFLICSSMAQAQVKVIALKGTAEIKLPGATEYTPLKQGDDVPLGASIRTGDGSNVFLTPLPGVTSTLDANSELVLEKRNRTTDASGKVSQEAILNLVRGTTNSNLDVEGTVTDFKIRTPKGIAAARGTILNIDSSGNLQVVEGTVLDENGTAYPEGSIVYEDPATGQRTSTTDINSLPPTIRAQAEAAGAQMIQTQITLASSSGSSGDGNALASAAKVAAKTASKLSSNPSAAITLATRSITQSATEAASASGRNVAAVAKLASSSMARASAGDPVAAAATRQGMADGAKAAIQANPSLAVAIAKGTVEGDPASATAIAKAATEGNPAAAASIAKAATEGNPSAAAEIAKAASEANPAAAADIAFAATQANPAAAADIIRAAAASNPAAAAEVAAATLRAANDSGTPVDIQAIADALSEATGESVDVAALQSSADNFAEPTLEDSSTDDPTLTDDTLTEVNDPLLDDPLLDDPLLDDGDEIIIELIDPTYSVFVSAGTGGSAFASGFTDDVIAGSTTGITATADPGFEFAEWLVSGDVTVADPYSASTTITINGNGSVTAYFSEIQTINEFGTSALGL